MSMFDKAQNLQIKDSSFTVVQNVGHTRQDSLNLLCEAVALNAILNAGGRADEVRCFPGTREEIIEKVERWMDGQRETDHRMLWLSGPAGAGKSAIAQTLAERGHIRGLHAANFFFFRGDKTRNHAQPLAATLIYQLVDFYPALRDQLTDILAAKPLAYKASVDEQFTRLVGCLTENKHESPIKRRIVLIIDGLDECEDESAQAQILNALYALVSRNGSPFRVMVSSRAESNLVMFFNKVASSTEFIFLNDEYRPRDDIRRFVIAKFDDIKQTHHLAHTLSADWPAQEDIYRIIRTSSGQFIYAATVMRFIEYSKDSPSLSLLTVLHMRPSTNHSPFAQLDAVYSHIFSKVRDIRAIKWALGLHFMATVYYGGSILRSAGYDTVELQSLFSDISAIAQLSIDLRGSLHVKFYHASLPDYLKDKSRSGIYHIDQGEVAADISTICFQKIHDISSFKAVTYVMKFVLKATVRLSNSLLYASEQLYNQRSFERPVHWDLLINTIIRLALFKRLLRSWLRFAYIHDFDPKLWQRGQDKAAYRYYDLYRVIEKVKFTLGRGVSI